MGRWTLWKVAFQPSVEGAGSGRRVGRAPEHQSYHPKPGKPWQGGQQGPQARGAGSPRGARETRALPMSSGPRLQDPCLCGWLGRSRGFTTPGEAEGTSSEMALLGPCSWASCLLTLPCRRAWGWGPRHPVLGTAAPRHRPSRWGLGEALAVGELQLAPPVTARMPAPSLRKKHHGNPEASGPFSAGDPAHPGPGADRHLLSPHDTTTDKTPHQQQGLARSPWSTHSHNIRGGWGTHTRQGRSWSLCSSWGRGESLEGPCLPASLPAC